MRKLVLILLFFVLQVTLFSQRVGVIRGIIRDKQTNVILPGATVSMKQNSLYAVTNGGGYFIFSNVNPGDFILTISYIGYETLEISVSVKESDTAAINAGFEFDRTNGK